MHSIFLCPIFLLVADALRRAAKHAGCAGWRHEEWAGGSKACHDGGGGGDGRGGGSGESDGGCGGDVGGDDSLLPAFWAPELEAASRAALQFMSDSLVAPGGGRRLRAACLVEAPPSPAAWLRPYTLGD